MRSLIIVLCFFGISLNIQAEEAYFTTRTVTVPNVGDQVDCVLKAKKLLEYLKYDQGLDHDNGSAWGKLRGNKQLKAGIRCAEGKEVILYCCCWDKVTKY